MPLAVACPKCNKKYSLPDKLIGKSVQCTECKTQFKTPSGRGAQAAKKQTANNKDRAKQLAGKQAAQAAAKKQAKELQQLGVDGPIRRAPDVFDGLGQMQGTPDPLSNHVIEDPGFGEAPSAVKQTSDINEEADPMAGMFENPALEPAKKKRPARKKRRATGEWHSQPWFLLTLVFVPVFIVASVLSFTQAIPVNIAYWVTMGAYWAFAFCAFVGWIWSIALAYEATKSTLQTILVAVVPFFVIYTIITNWEIMKPYAFFAIAYILISPLAVAAIIFFGIYQAL